MADPVTLSKLAEAARAVYDKAKTELAARALKEPVAKGALALMEKYSIYLEQTNQTDAKTGAFKFQDWVKNDSVGQATAAGIDAKDRDAAILEAQKGFDGDVTLKDTFKSVSDGVKIGVEIVKEKAQEAADQAGDHKGLFAGLLPLLAAPFTGGFGIMTFIEAIVLALGGDYLFHGKGGSIIGNIIDNFTGKGKKDDTTDKTADVPIKETAPLTTGQVQGTKPVIDLVKNPDTNAPKDATHAIDVAGDPAQKDAATLRFYGTVSPDHTFVATHVSGYPANNPDNITKPAPATTPLTVKVALDPKGNMTSEFTDVQAAAVSQSVKDVQKAVADAQQAKANDNAAKQQALEERALGTATPIKTFALDAIKPFGPVEVNHVSQDTSSDTPSNARNFVDIKTNGGLVFRVYGNMDDNGVFNAVGTKNYSVVNGLDEMSGLMPLNNFSFQTQAYEGRINANLDAQLSAEFLVKHKAGIKVRQDLGEDELLQGKFDVSKVQAENDPYITIIATSKNYPEISRSFSGVMDSTGRLGINSVLEKDPNAPSADPVAVPLKKPTLFEGVGGDNPETKTQLDKDKLTAGVNGDAFKDLVRHFAPDTNEKNFSKEITAPQGLPNLSTFNVGKKPAVVASPAP